MKQKLQVLFVVLIIAAQTVIQAQNSVTDSIGIPLVTYLYEIAGLEDPNVLDKVDSLGFQSAIINDITLGKYNSFGLGDYVFKIIPNQVTESVVGSGSDLINRYTEAKYSVWQVEGTKPEDGEATLKWNTNKTEKVENDTIIRTKAEFISSGTELINGPQYWQEGSYFAVRPVFPDPNVINYALNFYMKIEDLIPSVNMAGDTICQLHVTASYIGVDTITGEWDTLAYYVIDSLPVLYGHFNSTNQWQSFTMQYDLTGLPDSFYNNLSGKMIAPPTPNGWIEGERNHVQNIEYKIIWKGNSQNVRLYVDKIILSDERGRLLQESSTQTQILNMLNASYITSDYRNKISGWIGLDEPGSIDNFEPIRIINELLENNPDQNGAKLWISLGGSWNGHFGNTDNISAGQKIHRNDEFFKRVKRANVLQNFYPFDYPCLPDGPDAYCQNCDYRIKNIDTMADSFYAHLNQFPGAYWGTSIQVGTVPELFYRDIRRHEFLYQTNLALLYGSKIISPWIIYAKPTVHNGRTALMNFIGSVYQPTDKYYTLRDTIAPRLRGLMGTTLKRLTSDTTFAGSRGINYGSISWNSNPSGYTYIEDINPTGTIPALTEYGLDMGFFTDNINEDKRYFMVLNRYYSQENKYTIKLKNLDGFQNWNLRNYVDSTTITKLAVDHKCSFVDTLLRGDAILYSIAPVVIDGGSLIADDLTGTGITLVKDMIIESGATLYINGNYISKANITLKSGGKIINDENGKITFDAGKKLIIEGNAQINGTEEDRLTLEFNNASEEGIDIKQNASLVLSYCDVTNAQTGIKSEPGAGSINITNVNLTNCSENGIALLGTLDGDSPSTPPPPTIYNCNITGSSTGISVVNYPEILIRENTITNSDLGIILAQIPAAYIQGNRIFGNSSTELSGIFMESCGGYIRSNTIRDHINGIHIANSSPAIGGNLLELNKQHGLYVGSGSMPDLTASITGEPPVFYPASGYNKIYSNGQGEVGSLPDQNDGSEIYINEADMLLRSGCNEILDDRESTPTMNTFLLMNGSYRGNDEYLRAEYNYWGLTEPTQERFGDLPVLFDPYYLEVCPFPQSDENRLFVKTSSGETVDTLYPVSVTSENLSAMELSYAAADKHFVSGEYTQAKTIYEQIVQGEYSAKEKLFAYNKLYTIGNLLNADVQYFTNLQNSFNNISSTVTDSLLKKIYNQNAILCDVSSTEYISAITAFDNIILQNPDSEEALYAEIDILTTSLKLDTSNNQLGKMVDEKYLVKSSADYLSKLKGLLTDKFGVKGSTEEEIIPTAYSLYQNYPNPFNPSTTIKFDLPRDGMVELEIYDILGRRITKLVSEFKPAGSYEQRFDASNLASGTYIYQLKAGDFITSKKMMLVK